MNREQARAKAQALVDRMTLEEAAGQLRFDAPAIERLGVPAYNWWNEALHGVARAGTATSFPQAIGLAATFDPDLVRALGDVASTEGRAKYNAAAKHGDRDIYKERKALGRQLLQPILEAIDGDVDNTVFSFIPNTAEVAYYGMLEGFKEYMNEQKIKEIESLDHKPTHEELAKIMNRYVRGEKVAIKDIKLRTFIAEGNTRNDLAAHVYDITYGSLRAGIDNLVVIDDSIVRGTTLRESIIRILDRLHPKKIVIVSSSPQIRYPDYYGIDMSKMSEFIAFKAAVELLKDRHQENLITEVYDKCKAQVGLPKEQMVNYVKEIYSPFTDKDISRKMVEMLKAPEVKSDIEIVYQTIDGLHKACPKHTGDWYFSGDYPTPGGVRMVNQAFINYVEQIYNKQK